MSETPPATITIDGVTLSLMIERKRVKNINARLRGTTLAVSAPLHTPQATLDQVIPDLARRLEQQPGDALSAALIEQIYDSALLLEGLHPNPASMVERIQKLMEAAARGGA
ncbi:hypothetical protein SE17_16215 [Kouleothrix aurantiaca]|uniref:Uncharacterized protein n=1 Tax=Kouleothrix aurantiaca TaxID=186479 RepID=A0A0N8PSC2_9CHLR|nr:hypothetical protein SE17_16215 [Kouleothrix aurantiaca]